MPGDLKCPNGCPETFYSWYWRNLHLVDCPKRQRDYIVRRDETLVPPKRRYLRKKQMHDDPRVGTCGNCGGTLVPYDRTTTICLACMLRTPKENT